MTDKAVDKQLAKDIAKQLDRRRFRRRLLILALLVTGIVLAALYLTCGSGFGLGGKGKGSGSGPGSSATPALHRCALRVTAAGLTLDGKPANIDAAIAACKGGADVTVTGDAREGDWDALRTALDRAHIPYYKQR